MSEQAVEIESTDGVTLAARLRAGSTGQAALLCHPHPLYGGNMDNNVVLAAREALSALGLATLRFNFRGVGGSSGSHDEGRGEQQDLAAAFRYLEEHDAGRDGVHLVAYSFGAWVGVSALADGLLEPLTVTLVSPPTDFMSFAGLQLPSLPTLVVSGDSDQFGSVASVDSWLATQENARDQIERQAFPGVDHFYWSGEAKLKAALTEFHGSRL